MIEIRRTSEFGQWFQGLKDPMTRARIASRLDRLEEGLFGDVKYFHGIAELRIDLGPGYRVYFVRKGDVVIILLCGGDKKTQQRDISRARAMAKEL